MVMVGQRTFRRYARCSQNAERGCQSGIDEYHAIAAASYLASARKDAANNNEHVALDSAFVRALLAAKRYADALPIAEDLLKTYPSSDAAFGLYVDALVRLRRFDDMEHASAERSKQFPGNVYPLRNASFAAEDRGDFTSALTYTEKIIASGKAEPLDWNQYAWESLFAGKADAALADSLQRNVPDERADAGIVHTMASVMAEIGKSD